MAGSAPLSVAYFSMEICLEQTIPTYSGGLGVLAGDTNRTRSPALSRGDISYQGRGKMGLWGSP